MHVAEEYLSGLLQCEKGHENMERMVEKVNDSDYKRYIHFLSVSKWSASDVNLVTMKSVDSSFREQKIRSSLPTGFIIDETSYLKKGWKRSKVHTVTVWHWDRKEEKACKRTLVSE